MVGFTALRAISKSRYSGARGHGWSIVGGGEGCGQERARESKDDRLGSSTGSLLANSTTGVIRWGLGEEHREISTVFVGSCLL